MQLESIKEILMRRDGLPADEADAYIAEGRQRVLAGADPEDVLYEDFCLEPDYIFDLLEGLI